MSLLFVQLWTHLGGAWQTPRQYLYYAAASCVADMLAPVPGSKLTATTATFTWNAGTAADNYWMDVGNSLGQGDILAVATADLSQTASGLPCDGRTLYVQLWSHINGAWQPPMQYTYAAWAACGAVTTPAPGATFTSSTVTFSWTAGTGVSAYMLDVGTAPGQGDIFSANVGTALSRAVSGIPINGNPIYVQLSAAIGGVWYRSRYIYTAMH